MSQQEKAPQGWIKVSLGDVIELKYGKALPAKMRDGEYFPVYGSNGIVGYHSEPIVNGPALIIGRKGSIGEVHLSEKDCSPIDTTYFVDEFHGQPPSFWLHRLRCLNLADLNRATALPGLNRNDAYQLTLLLPPLKEQYRIVEKTEALKARSSNARKALEAISPLLEKFRQSVLSSAFRGDLTADWRAQNLDIEPAEKLLKRIRKERRKRWEEDELAKMKAKDKTPKDDKWKKKYKEPEPVDTTDLPELPAGWCWAKTDELFCFVTSGSRGWAQYYSEKGDIFLRIGNQERKSINLDLSNTQYVQPPEGKEGVRTQVEENDILISITADIGIISIIPKDLPRAYINQHIALARPVQSIEAKFLALYLSSTDGQEQLQNLKRGATKAGLGLDDIRSVVVPLPSISEQKRIVLHTEKKFVSIENIRNKLSSSSTQIMLLDQSILSKAFRGELVPQDPNDEPASQLLKRIKQEKASLEAERKQKGKVGKKKTVPRKKEVTEMAKKNERRPLVEVLQPHASGLSPKALFQQAGFDEHTVDEFYVELKNEVVSGNIIEDRPDNERVILRLNAA